MRRREFLKTTTAATAAVMTAPYIHPARAQGRNDTLLTLSESGPNNLDIMGVGTNRPGYEASWNTHDRLVTFGSKPDANGVDHYDYTKIEPELAESWDLHDMSVTFTLRSGAKFHDGTPVTAHDVKWSFDRAVTVGGFPSFQMRAGPHRQHEKRKGHDRVDDPADDPVGPAAEIPGRDAEQGPDGEGERDRGDGDAEIDPGGDDDPAENIAAELVGAEQMGRRRPGQRPGGVAGERVVRHQ